MSETRRIQTHFGLSSFIMESISDTDILRPLSEKELLVLIDLYREKGELYHSMSLYNHYRWDRRVEDLGEEASGRWKALKKTYFTHRHGNLEKNGTYISFQRDTVVALQFHTLEESLNELKECISETKLIDWASGPLFTGISSHIADVIVTAIKTNLDDHSVCEMPCTCFSLKHELALKMQVPSVPEGFELRSLTERYAEYVHSYWPHNDEASSNFISGMIRLNLSLGIFRSRDDRLVGWVLQNEFFGLGLLQVIPEEQGKGFGKILTRAMCRKIAETDENDITSFAMVNNTRSESILKGVGFKKNCLTKWVQFKNLKL